MDERPDSHMRQQTGIPGFPVLRMRVGDARRGGLRVCMCARSPVQRPHHPRTRRSRRRPPQPVQLRPAGTVRHHQQTVQAAAQLPARRCSPRPTRRPGSVVVDRCGPKLSSTTVRPRSAPAVGAASAGNERKRELDPALAGLDVPVEPVGGQVVAGQQRADRRSAAGRHRRLAPPVGGPQGRRRNPGSCR